MVKKLNIHNYIKVFITNTHTKKIMYTDEQNIRYTHFLHELWNEFKLKSYYLILDDSKKEV